VASLYYLEALLSQLFVHFPLPISCTQDDLSFTFPFTTPSIHPLPSPSPLSKHPFSPPPSPALISLPVAFNPLLL